MISVSETLSTIKAALEINLPPLLSAAGLTDFETYHIGSSRNAKEKGIFCYQNDGLLSYSNHNLSIIVHLQMYRTDEEEAAKYTDIVKNYLFDLDIELLGFDLLDRIEFDSYYDVQERVGYTFIMPYWNVQNSDCDIR